MALDDPVEVFAAADAAEAHFVSSLLKDAGIEPAVVGEPLGSILGDVPFFVAGPRIWVRSVDLDRARGLIADYQARVRARQTSAQQGATGHAPPDPSSAFCYHCGEPVGTGANNCPACGQALDWKD